MVPKYLRLFLFFLLFCGQAIGQRSIDTNVIFNIGGIKQYTRIKGKDISKPIILILHGGPGGSLLQKTDQLTGRLQNHFVVVQWDQRETGETLKLNKSPGMLALKMFYDDTRDLVDSLLTRFHKPKLYLAGYSWGSGLGFNFAANFPERLYAYIAISPVINQWKSENMALEMLRASMGKKARNELAQVKIPFENADQLYYHRKWLFKYSGQKMVNLTFPKSFIQGWAAAWFDVWIKSCDVNLFESLPRMNCPIYFFAGGKDYQTNFTITRDYYNFVSAPKKDFFLFDDAGHGLPETDSELFQDVIIDRILPQSYTSSAGGTGR